MELMLAKHKPDCFAVMFINVPINKDGALDWDAWEKHCNCGAVEEAHSSKQAGGQ